MKTTKYTVNRNFVCLGFVVEKTDPIITTKLTGNKKGVLPHPGGLGIHIKSGQLYIPNGNFLRMMLFIPTQEGRTNDLQWDSEEYPIVNLCSESTLTNSGGHNIVIDGHCNLGKLLEHFGYGSELNANDISKIASEFFSRDFAYDNCHLFGYQKVHPRELSGDDYDIYRPNTFRECGRTVIYKSADIAYVKTSNGILPSELFEFLCAARSLSNMGRDISMFDCQKNGMSADKFAPHPEEVRRGFVRVLAPRNPNPNPLIFN